MFILFKFYVKFPKCLSLKVILQTYIYVFKTALNHMRKIAFKKSINPSASIRKP